MFHETIDTGAETRPSYIKHALRGVEVIFLRPDLNRCGDEEVADSLRCFGCRERLQFDQWTFTKRGTCKMILTTGRPHFLVEGSYKCTGCKRTYGASQYEMRVMQPPRIQSDLPVDTASKCCLSSGTSSRSRHSRGDSLYSSRFSSIQVSLAHAPTGVGWLLGQELEDFIYEDVVTYEGCQKVMDRQEKVLRLKYNRHMIDYLDSIRRYRVKCPDDARPFKAFPPFATWLGRRLPSGQALQMRIEKAYYLPGSGGDLVSRHNYRRMQIQPWSLRRYLRQAT